MVTTNARVDHGNNGSPEREGVLSRQQAQALAQERLAFLQRRSAPMPIRETHNRCRSPPHPRFLMQLEQERIANLTSRLSTSSSREKPHAPSCRMNHLQHKQECYARSVSPPEYAPPRSHNWEHQARSISPQEYAPPRSHNWEHQARSISPPEYAPPRSNNWEHQASSISPPEYAPPRSNTWEHQARSISPPEYAPPPSYNRENHSRSISPPEYAPPRSYNRENHSQSVSPPEYATPRSYNREHHSQSVSPPEYAPPRSHNREQQSTSVRPPEYESPRSHNREHHSHYVSPPEYAPPRSHNREHHVYLSPPDPRNVMHLEQERLAFMESAPISSGTHYHSPHLTAEMQALSQRFGAHHHAPGRPEREWQKPMICPACASRRHRYHVSLSNARQSPQPQARMGCPQSIRSANSASDSLSRMDSPSPESAHNTNNSLPNKSQSPPQANSQSQEEKFIGCRSGGITTSSRTVRTISGESVQADPPSESQDPP